ncbi:MAG: trypsin-like serine protease [Oceanicaulis sp.]
MKLALAALLGAFVVFAGLASASTQGAPRHPVTSAEPPYSAIGLLQFEDGICTGALIGPDVVLTAAHCLVREDGLSLDGRFVAGIGGAGEPERAGFEAVSVLPGLDRGGVSGAALLRNGDWALVRLDQPLGDRFGVLDVEAAVDNRPRRPDLIGALAMVVVAALAAAATHGRTRTVLAGLSVLGLVLLAALAVRALLAPDWRDVPVRQAGYGPSGGAQLIGGPPCRILRFRPSGLIEHSCRIAPGDSGSPLLVRRADGWAVVAVVSYVHFSPEGTRYWATAAAAVPDPEAAFAGARIGE